MAGGAPKVLQRGERARSVAGTSVVERWRALSKHTCWACCWAGMIFIAKDECETRACEFNELFQKDCRVESSR